MGIELGTPEARDLPDIVTATGEWQVEGGPFQLHPGDIGWFGWGGGDSTASALRTWRQDGELVAVGLLDGPGLLRLTIAPGAIADEQLAARMADDIGSPDGRVLPPGAADVEAPVTAALRDALMPKGWGRGDAWTHLRRSLTEAVEPVTGVRVETVGEDTAHVRTAVHRAAFGRDGFGDEQWRSMSAGPAYRQARCLVGYAGEDAVAAITVWSAGPGRPGIIEPMGVDPQHRGRGYGVAVCLAGALALQELGASSAVVGTPSANLGAVATYSSAGFTADPQVHDLRRA